jgi:putative hemin transport protein
MVNPTENGLSGEKRQQLEAVLRDNPSQMTLQLARQFGVPEVEIIRALPGGRSIALDAGRWEELLRSFEELGQVHVIVTNGATTCEVNGQFGGFSTWGEFFNVQSPSLDLHIRWRELAAAFVVIKPGHLDGNEEPLPEVAAPSNLVGRRVTLSVQFYDRRGESALKVFLNFGGTVSAERAAQAEAIVQRFRKGLPETQTIAK